MDRIRRNELMNDARQAHLRYLARPIRFTLLDRILVVLGGLLIAIGERLQRRCLLAISHGREAHPTKT